MRLTEISSKLPSKLYHVTETSNIPRIQEEGLEPHTGKRGVKYGGYRIYLFKSLDQEILEEVKSMVLFGGHDEDQYDSRAVVPLSLLVIDVDELKDFDRTMANDDSRWHRTWGTDRAMTHGYGVWTDLPIPAQAITAYSL